MNPVRKVRLSDSVINSIKEMIVEDDFKPGDKFYSENELTRKLQVSRSSLREALRILEVTGRVSVKQGKGIFITDRQGQQFSEFSSWLKANEQSIRDNFEVRLIIEPKAAGYAAEKADKKDIARMEEAYNSFVSYAKVHNVEEAIVCDGKFHRLLAGATKNKTLFVLMKAMIMNLPNGWISSLYTPGRIEQTVDEHNDILQAIKKRDKIGAENAMTRHLLNALHDISVHLKKKQQADRL